jgi:cell division protein ZapA (FtsZ GTPase activity inhibitor)
MADQNKDSKGEIKGAIVEIFGDEYRIGGEPAQVQPVAAYVDKKMTQMAAEHGGRLPKAQVAILTAMEITAELFSVMRNRTDFTEKAHASIDRLTKLVEDRAKMSDVGLGGEEASAPERRMRERSIRIPDPSVIS